MGRGGDLEARNRMAAEVAEGAENHEESRLWRDVPPRTALELHHADGVTTANRGPRMDTNKHG